ncbi:hypothetical protein PVAP13_1NG215676 [Panicum virgatum]|uniref:Uncharacterized protein n=1 Tax=Panicum virgatum TaxID=38727 RepID=A0A8T0WMW1_PANVG|nr:hypothetical protein PVAP13_1NG215676 [Panicum virgatum]
MATGAARWSKLTRSSSIIVLLVAVALAMAPIAHQSDDLTRNTTDQRPDYQYPIPPSGRPGGGGSRSPHGRGGGGSHSPNGPPCTSCPYPGACPWCHVR